jgi:uncharacterized membrane protein YkvA (DUF1232 family)
MTKLEWWRQKVGQLKVETYALYLAYQDPRTPWYARIFAALVVGYAFSPLDLIPDFIPILGLLDDLVLVPLGIVLARRLIPASVLTDCRLKAKALMTGQRPTNRIAASVIIAIWLLLAGLALFLIIT